MGKGTRSAVVVAMVLALVGWLGISRADAGGGTPIFSSPSVVSPGEDFTASAAGDCVDYSFTVLVPDLGLEASVSGMAGESWSTTFTVPAGTDPGGYQVITDYTGECVAYSAGFVTVGSISLTKTVGTDPDTCASATSISVEAGTTVYYCYTVTNNTPAPLATHSLTDDKLGALLTDAAYDLAPGASVSTVDLGVEASATPTSAVTNTATWTAPFVEKDGDVPLTASASATVTVTAPIDVDAPPAQPVVAVPTLTG